MEKYILKAKTVIAGTELSALENAAVQVEAGKITEIYENANQIPEELQNVIVDLGDKTLIPGMIDCHNHLALDTRSSFIVLIARIVCSHSQSFIFTR